MRFVEGGGVLGAGLKVEHYAYDGTGRLTEVRLDRHLVLDANRIGSVDAELSVVSDSVVTDRRYYDEAGQLIQSGLGEAVPSHVFSDDWSEVVPGDREYTRYGREVNRLAQELREYGTQVMRYDERGLLQTQVSYKSDGSATSEVRYGAGAYDGVGNVRAYSVLDRAGRAPEVRHELSYVAGNGYQLDTMISKSSGRQDGKMSNAYDANGFLVRSSDDRQVENSRAYVNDAQGRILMQRTGVYAGGLNGAETGPNEANVQRQLIVNGDVLGRYGRAINPDVPYTADGKPNVTTISGRDALIGNAWQPLEKGGGRMGSYTAQGGESLRDVAKNLLGDSRLWYLLAQANGLADADTRLSAVQSLKVPSSLGGVFNGDGSSKPYNSGELIGDLSPYMPPAPPQGKKGCGALGTVIMIVVAVVVTVATQGAATSFWTGVFGAGNATAATVAGYATAAAAGSIASQAVGMAIGQVDEFSWKQVGMSALAGGVTGGLTPDGAATAGTAAQASTQFSVQAVGRAMVANALSQGIGVAVGLQDRFDWRGVAAAGVGNAVGQAVGNALSSSGAFSDLGKFGQSVAQGTVRGFAAGTAAALARGGRVTVQQVAVDAFGNALGDSLAESMKPATQGVGPWSDKDYRNGADIESDQATAQREAMYGLAGMGARLGESRRSLGDVWAGMTNESIDRGARAWANWDSAFGDYVAKQNAEEAIKERESLIRRNAKSELERRAIERGYVADVANESQRMANRAVAAPLTTRRWDMWTASAEANERAAQVAKAQMPQMSAWDGVHRDAPAVAYLKSGTRGMNAAAAGSWHYQQALSVQDGLAMGGGEILAAPVLGLAARGVSTVRGAVMSERSLLLSSLNSEMRVGLQADLGISASLAPLDANVASITARRSYLSEKFGRTGDLHLDINIRGRQEVATNFFLSQGVSEGKIPSYLTGIDFTRSVELQTLGAGKQLWQYQSPGAPQGSWYSLSPSVQPTELGISPLGFNRAAQSVEPKVLNPYVTTEPVTVLRSTAAPVVDFWSVQGQTYSTVGGAQQLFSNQSSLFRLGPR